MSQQRLVIVGGGPVGLEAALYAARLGHDVTVLERGCVGDSVRRWGHVSMFTPWSMNTSALGLTELRIAGRPAPPREGCPSGADWVARYLEPLARSAPLAGKIREGCRVLEIGRKGLDKAHPLGEARAGRPFVLRVEDEGCEARIEADLVIDCSGTFGQPNHLGNGGIPALGETRLAPRIDRTLEALAPARLPGFAGQRVLLVGDGLSAATAAVSLAGLERVRVEWVSRRDAPPYRPATDDPLPGRAAVERDANALAAGGDPRFRFQPAARIERMEERDGDIHVELSRDGSTFELDVDRVLGLVGYRPDSRLYEELQVHQCYASSGPMALAATLLSASSDCLAQSSAGAETLLHPEPGFFILGAKSYGRNASFLFRLGLEQIRDLFAWIETRPELDLYAA